MLDLNVPAEKELVDIELNQRFNFNDLTYPEQIKLMLHCGMHYSHKYCHPHFKSFLMRDADKHIIDLRLTSRLIARAQKLIQSVLSNNGSVLFVGNKAQIHDIVIKEAKRCMQYWSAERWRGGNLTNFDENVAKGIARLERLASQSQNSDLYTKEDQVRFAKQYNSSFRYLGGMFDGPNSDKKPLQSIPKLVIIIDPVAEYTAVKEVLALRKKARINMIIFGDCRDTISKRKEGKFDIRKLDQVRDVFVPANDDGVASVELFLNIMANQILSTLSTLPEAPAQKQEQSQRSLESRLMDPIEDKRDVIGLNTKQSTDIN